MNDKLRLGPLPKIEAVRLTITLPATAKADLDRYAELYASTYGEPVDAAALAPHMLSAFMDRDRAFRRARHEAKSRSDGNSPPLPITDATSSAKDMPSDASSSR
jgi:hypothetical protein